MKKQSPFSYFKMAPEVIRLGVLMSDRLPRSLCQVEDFLHKQGIGFSYETVGARLSRFGANFSW
jgi:hypothetical protein